MGRSLSWLERLFPISRAVAGSIRSHYSRKDLQELFELQPRASQNLMSAMPVVPVGSSYLVEREALLAFLRQMTDSDDPATLYSSLRGKPGKIVRRKLRTLSLHHVSADLDLPPASLTLRPGEMNVRFNTLEELAEAMVYLATVLQEKLDDFAARYEPRGVPQGEEPERLS